MRTKKELLELLLKELPYRLKFGICYLIEEFFLENLLTIYEYNVLTTIIENNATDRYRLGCAYYFPTGELQPRIEYLQMLIKKYSDGQD